MFFSVFMEDGRLVLVYRAVCTQETASRSEGAQLSANRFYSCGITDNPGRFDNKSTQVTPAQRRTGVEGKTEEEEVRTKAAERGGANTTRQDKVRREREREILQD